MFWIIESLRYADMPIATTSVDVNNTTTDAVERDIEQLYEPKRSQTTEHERVDAAEWLIEQFKAIDSNTLSSTQFEAFMALMVENTDSKFLQDCFEEYRRRKKFQVAVSTAS